MGLWECGHWADSQIKHIKDRLILERCTRVIGEQYVVLDDNDLGSGVSKS